jgi:hypothetical protein
LAGRNGEQNAAGLLKSAGKCGKSVANSGPSILVVAAITDRNGS